MEIRSELIQHIKEAVGHELAVHAGDEMIMCGRNTVSIKIYRNLCEITWLPYTAFILRFHSPLTHPLMAEYDLHEDGIINKIISHIKELV